MSKPRPTQTGAVVVVAFMLPILLAWVCRQMLTVEQAPRRAAHVVQADALPSPEARR